MLNRRGYWTILIAMALAIVAGLSQQPYVLKFAEIIAEVFVRLLKLISLPIISLSLLATISSVTEQSLSKIGKNIVQYTILTTGVAASIALGFYWLFRPVTAISVEGVTATLKQPAYLDEILKIVPNNLLQPFLEGNVVSIMLLSLLIGIGITKLPKEQRFPISQLLQSLFSIMMQLTRWIVGFMPFAIWAFMTSFVVELSQGLPFSKLAWYLTTIVCANLTQAIIILPLFLLLHGIKPIQAFRKMLPALSFAFFTKSSAAAIPTAIDCAEKELDIDKKVARFCFPLCTSINMNACAAFILITVLFVAESSGMSFSVWQKLSWIVIATIAAIGNAGVPMGCFFIASALLTTMNVPVKLLMVILPFYAILDMLESAINIWSDSCVTLAVNKRAAHAEVGEIETPPTTQAEGLA
jgi:Na+/H+-dicarboxylate symporter